MNNKLKNEINVSVKILKIAKKNFFEKGKRQVKNVDQENIVFSSVILLVFSMWKCGPIFECLKLKLLCIIY